MVAVQRALGLRPLSHHALGQHLSDAFHARWITGVPADVGAELEGSRGPVDSSGLRGDLRDA